MCLTTLLNSCGSPEVRIPKFPAYLCYMLKSTLLKATQAGGKILQHYFNGNLQISSKSTVNDLVTEADKQSEKAVMDTIRETFPDHFILSEEAGELSTSSSIKWIIDPLDGTVNFAHG